jgi:hypothetical protein
MVMKTRILTAFGLGLLLSACQSTKTAPVDLGVGDAAGTQTDVVAQGTVAAAGAGNSIVDTATEPGRITDVELRAYCPKVDLREGTAFYRTYEKGGKETEDANLVIYQAALAETSRDCKYSNGTLTMTVAASGRVVPGPKGKAGTISMPIRVAVTRGDEVLYSKLSTQEIQIAESGATQFVFKDTEVSFPQPTARNITVFIGYDEGPPAKK